MAPFLEIDSMKAKRGKAMTEDFIYLSFSTSFGGTGAPSDRSEEPSGGSMFREVVLPFLCRNHSMEDYIAPYQAKYDCLRYGEVFSAWLFSAKGFNERSWLPFTGNLELIEFEKVEPHCPMYARSTNFTMHGMFIKSANRYEKICKRFLGDSGFNHIKSWSIFQNLFRRETRRTKLLTVDEVECLLEYVKLYVLQKYFPENQALAESAVAKKAGVVKTIAAVIVLVPCMVYITPTYKHSGVLEHLLATLSWVELFIIFGSACSSVLFIAAILHPFNIKIQD